MGIKLTDGKVTVVISMDVWNEETASYGVDISYDFFQDVDRTREIINDVYLVSDVSIYQERCQYWERESDNNVVSYVVVNYYVVEYMLDDKFMHESFKGTMTELMFYLNSLKEKGADIIGAVCSVGEV